MGSLALNLETPSTAAVVDRLQDCDQDFEWYPTTDAMIEAVRADLRSHFYLRDDEGIGRSVLDCGAGDGRVLEKLTQGDRYAIEKARPHLDGLDRSIFVVGTDFHGQTLIDKRVDVVFSNPPYSEFEQWTVKIVREARAQVLYLVVPQRWEHSQAIQDALEARRAETTVVSESDFHDGPRQARARVQILRVDLARSRGFNAREPSVDPFELWFEENFPLNVSERSQSEFDIERGERDKAREQVQGSGELISHRGLVAVLEELYQKELAKLMANYQRLCELDSKLLHELDVNLRGVQSALKLKITSLKDAYWRELFDNLSSITDRLTSSSRRRLLDTLTEHTHVDFTADNARAVAGWVVKNANYYLDQQLIEVFEKMVNQANVQMYRSNERTFGEELWRFGRCPAGLERYGLDYRVVLENLGGICTSPWSFDRTYSGLEGRAETFLDDLATVANNIGFNTRETRRASSFAWESGRKAEFYFRDHVSGTEQILMEAKAYKNGNLHLKLNQAFIQRLNVEFGRLKGWLKSAAEAASELDIDEVNAQAAFDTNYQIEPAAGGGVLKGLEHL